MDTDKIVVFTPDNEPYLGRDGLFRLDKLICSCLEISGNVAPQTRAIAKTDLQQAACQLIPQGISIALSIRELIRQGYLFGALVLVRPLQERALILLYVYQNPKEIAKWTRGWLCSEAPNLSTMIESIAKSSGNPLPFDKRQATAMHNALQHAKPDCAVWTMVPLDGGKFGHVPSKILNNPALCDRVCEEAFAWLYCIQAMILALFPTEAFGTPDKVT